MVVVLKESVLGIFVSVVIGIMVFCVNLLWFGNFIIWLVMVKFDIFLLMVEIVLVILLFGLKGNGGLDWYLFVSNKLLVKFMFVVVICIWILFFFGLGRGIFFRIRLFGFLYLWICVVFIVLNWVLFWWEKWYISCIGKSWI